MSVLGPLPDEHEHAFVPLPIIDIHFRLGCKCGRILATMLVAERDVEPWEIKALLESVRDNREALRESRLSLSLVHDSFSSPTPRLSTEVLRRLEPRAVTLAYTGDSDTAYFELLRGLWGKGTLFIVEHDIGVMPDTLAEMEGCPEDWCACFYPYQRGKYAGLGCVKFSYELQISHPDVFEVMTRYGEGDVVHPPRHWCSLDQRLGNELRGPCRETQHQHGEVEHLSTGWPSHGCTPQ